ncbi:hypothetical protein C8R44DRAFT_895335 [Mycena epipterygia]|nr:hypothetical protein C8R44DRAFT_895335 [Mycena epipterygia]
MSLPQELLDLVVEELDGDIVSMKISSLTVNYTAHLVVAGVHGLGCWKILPSLLRILPNLESFHMHARFEWRSIDHNPSLSSAISNILNSPKLVSIHFRGVDILPSYISRSPALHTLLLNDLVIDPATPMALNPRVQIRYLGLSPWTLKKFAGADCPFDMKHLLKLRACPQHNNAQYAALQNLLNTCSKSLLELQCLPFLTIGDVPPHFELDLSRLSSL